MPMWRAREANRKQALDFDKQQIEVMQQQIFALRSEVSWWWTWWRGHRNLELPKDKDRPVDKYPHPVSLPAPGSFFLPGYSLSPENRFSTKNPQKCWTKWSVRKLFTLLGHFLIFSKNITKMFWTMFPYTVKYTESESDIQNNNLLYKIH